MDLIGALPTGRVGVKYAIVTVDSYTMLVEAELLVHITAKQVVSFVNKFIICRFGVPYKIITNNGTQFRDLVGAYCEETGYKENFQLWCTARPMAMWRPPTKTTPHTTIIETPFSLTYGCEAVLPVEMQINFNKVQTFEEIRNEEALAESLDKLEEKREKAQMKVAVYQQRATRYHNSRV
ncbi:uncharacterized protein LOC133039246 [Cannabis sativa]|uniref:uncharacterized protein LOC133039246 n=1 Tax=Cannabis sativa TaxID=3483 RepID=UPI0029C9C9FA|nr:uncharacterized protein LOC133039246 [Cannabis sativa]